MTPALRKQLFERWKELSVRKGDTCKSFNYFINSLDLGKVHLQRDNVQSTFFDKDDSFHGSMCVLREVRKLFGIRK